MIAGGSVDGIDSIIKMLENTKEYGSNFLIVAMLKEVMDS